MTTVEEIMTPNPERGEVTDSIRDVLFKLIEMDVRHLPIVNNGELIGMISDRDLRTFTTPFIEAENAAPSDSRLDSPIVSLMTGDVISVNQETEITEVIDLMIDFKVGAVPVVDGITGALLGIVSYIDVIRHVQDIL